jgi:hypothetical protein
MYKTLACSEGVVNFGGDFAPRSDASPHQGQGWCYALRHFNVLLLNIYCRLSNRSKVTARYGMIALLVLIVKSIYHSIG